ncbi:class I SAM-dependent methyltransferase [Pseudofrankia asymbiotica]|uniref:SAM-dependent methyltransferase n=1 Tax=Pseudofrankia asymbiotica TaxID=1834516 RepID=A0A1V2I100_9ACTN|nr:class I SAM-dependent methyltransferase [Pseudofrankia asymbiotica]ONH23189.1 SAM-dependent methyltransferase [Pseudofrankia asymbiotica]
MNEKHLTLCSSAEWAETVERWIIPWALESVDLGDDVLEVGPGPGLTTDVLRARAQRLTAVEADPELAANLTARLADSNVTVVSADATAAPLPDGRFSGAVCLTMLHHVPSAAQQDALFAEVCRLLVPGGLFAGSDSLDSPEFRDLHEGDVCVPVDPGGLAGRLRAVGYIDVHVDTNEYALRFRGRKPPRDY